MIVLLIAGSLWGCRQGQMQPEANQPGVIITDTTWVDVTITGLVLPPVSTFEDTCARCHGPESSFYGPQFARLQESELMRVVREMMQGPALLQPTDAEVRATTAYQ